MTEPLLLHSLTTFSSLLLPALERVGPARICEIGSEGGGFSRELAEWAAAHGAEVWCIEPYPAPPVMTLATERAGHFHLIRGRSPGALADVPPCDVYVVDGDHNYATVSGELRAIAEATADAGPALVVLHDVNWPWARRDLYYDPTSMPAGDVLPHASAKGVVPGREELVDGGFRGEGQFWPAEREGGPRNGVLTAVEDFVAEADAYELLRVPNVFGLGLLFPSGAPWAAGVREVFAPFDDHPLLATLERNRIALYLQVIALQDALAQQALRADRVTASVERRLAEVEGELSRLRLEHAREGDGRAPQPAATPS